MKIITLKLHNQSEWQFLQDLLRRLNIRFEWKEEKKVSPSPASSRDIISELFGSWPSDKTSDELNKSLAEARVNQSREIAL